MFLNGDIIKLKNIFHWKKNKTPPPIIGSIDMLENILREKKNIDTGKDGNFNIDYHSYSLIYKNEDDNKKNVLFQNENFIDKFKLVYREIFGNDLCNFIPISSKDKKNISSYESFINELLNNQNDIAKTLSDLENSVSNDTVYRLSDIEKNYCILISKNIAFHNIISGARERKFSNRDPIIISIQGNFGELAVCRMLKLPCQMHFTYPRSTSTDTFDGTLVGKYKIDIKTVVGIGKYPLLVMEHKKSNPADIYILAEIGFNDKNNKPINCNSLSSIQKDKMIMDPDINVEVNIAGFAHKDMVFSSKKISMMGSYSQFYKIDRSSLMNLSELINYLKST